MNMEAEQNITNAQVCLHTKMRCLADKNRHAFYLANGLSALGRHNLKQFSILMLLQAKLLTSISEHDYSFYNY